VAQSSWRITVRQLESMIRLSEAMARMSCSAEVQPRHVQEAFRLLNKSIIRVETPDVDLDDENLEEGVASGANDMDIDNGGVANGEGVVNGVNGDGVHGEVVNGAVNDPALTDGGDHLTNGADTEKQATEKAVMEVGVVKKPVQVVKRRVTFEEYKTITNLLVLHLRHMEESKEGEWQLQGELCLYSSDRASSGDEGVHKQDLVNWYLDEVQENISTMEELTEVKLKVEKIIDKLVHQVGVV